MVAAVLKDLEDYIQAAADSEDDDLKKLSCAERLKDFYLYQHVLYKKE
jgi:hypothetical protein